MTCLERNPHALPPTSRAPTAQSRGAPSSQARKVPRTRCIQEATGHPAQHHPGDLRAIAVAKQREEVSISQSSDGFQFAGIAARRSNRLHAAARIFIDDMTFAIASRRRGRPHQFHLRSWRGGYPHQDFLYRALVPSPFWRAALLLDPSKLQRLCAASTISPLNVMPSMLSTSAKSAASAPAQNHGP